jgi:3-oxoacyl-[acyl-carrier-protein] synthase II
MAIVDAYIRLVKGICDQVFFINADQNLPEIYDIFKDEQQIAHSVAMNISLKKSANSLAVECSYNHNAGIEAWATINMMNDEWFSPALNLNDIDPACGQLDYIQGQARNINTDHVMSNNFAFGGINTSIIFKRWNHTS